MKIFKYTLPVMDTATVENNIVKMPIVMPKQATLLSVQNQQGEIALWAEVDEMEEDGKRLFIAALTGHEFTRPITWVFIGTVQLGRLVFHIYDAGE